MVLIGFDFDQFVRSGESTREMGTLRAMVASTNPVKIGAVKAALTGLLRIGLLPSWRWRSPGVSIDVGFRLFAKTAFPTAQSRLRAAMFRPAFRTSPFQTVKPSKVP